MNLQELYTWHEDDVRERYPTLVEDVNFVPGEGERRGYMFIAEAPGATEDKKQRPLVGDAGKLLRSILEEIEFPSDRFFTNVWKWRPPNNRPPSRTEITLGLLCLRPEIGFINPHTITVLGRTANAALFPRPLKRGDLYLGRFRIIATYHPGYLLGYRHPELVPEFKSHLRSAVRY